MNPLAEIRNLIMKGAKAPSSGKVIATTGRTVTVNVQGVARTFDRGNDITNYRTGDEVTVYDGRLFGKRRATKQARVFEV